MTKQLVLAVLAAGLHSSRAFAPSPALLRFKASSGPLRSVLRHSTSMVAETVAPPATTLVGGLPSWMRASAPVQDWVDCGDMANLTYKHSKELTAISPAAIEADLGADLKNLKYELVTALYTRCPGLRSETVFAGFIAKRTVSEGVIDVFVAWRGTILSDEWNLDASFDLVPAPLTNNLHVHQGFINLYISTTDSNGVKSGTAALQQLVSDTATTVRRVFVTGHSLGGALATLSAYDIARNVGGDGVAPTLVTFSGPRAASVELAIELNRVVTDHTRIFSDGDLVPASPLYLGEKLRRNSQLAQAIINDINDQKDGISATTALTAVHKAARALDNAIDDAVARGEQPTAQYHHAGAGVVVSAAALPDEPAIRAIPWTIGNHHNLAMILYLLDPTDARLELMKQQFKV